MAKEVDELFQLPLAEFTLARNALAARLKKAGRDEDAAFVKGLAKPTLSAWTVNQLYWRHRGAFDRLMTAGAAFRAAQSAQLAGRPADLRGPLEARRDALADLARTASAILREAGHAPTPDMMRRITTTLEALAAHGSAPGAPPAGRLTDDIDPPGLETLAALVPGVGVSSRRSGPTRVLAFTAARRGRAEKVELLDERRREGERRARRAAAKAAVQAAERDLREARRRAQQAEAALKRAAARAKEAEREKVAAEERLEQAAAAAEQARQQARAVASQAEEAAQAVEDAEHALEQARRAYAELSD
jgi:hypothetical protein